MRLTYDQFMMALCLWREARGESRAAKTAVLSVIRNRATDERKRWPRTAAGVIVQPFQFSAFNLGEPNSVKWPIENKGGPDWNAWLECLTVVNTPLEADPTDGANHYHDSSIDPPFRAWLGKAATLADLEKKRTCQIGAFTFYKL